MQNFLRERWRVILMEKAPTNDGWQEENHVYCVLALSMLLCQVVFLLNLEKMSLISPW